jgi:uncharacterized tellurite resistance protein B-like protein
MSVIDQAVDRLGPAPRWVHFQGPLSEDAIPLSVPEAMAVVMVASIWADGARSAEESARLTSLLSTSRMLRQAAADGDSDLGARALTLLDAHGSGPILEACARTLPPDLRESAFALAADLVFADGRVEEREKAYLDQLQQVLGIDDAAALKIVEVMMIKNRT